MFKIKLNRKIIIATAVSLIFLFILVGVILLPLYKNSKEQIKEYTRADELESVLEDEIILCNFDLKNPEYVNFDESIFKDRSFYDIYYYKLSRQSIFSQSWKIKYNGGSTIELNIEDIDFEKLTKMAKDDCEQFRQSYPSPTNPRKDDDDTDISWIYNPPPTDKEIKEQEAYEKQQDERRAEELKTAREGNYLMIEEFLEIYEGLSVDTLAELDRKFENDEINGDYELALWMKENGHTNKEINDDYLLLNRFDSTNLDDLRH